MEHFDESIVLMKDLLCWTTEDIKSLHLNVHNPKLKSKINDQGKARLRKWLHADVLLYEHFSQIFKAKVAAFGATKMALELQKVQDLNRKSSEKCPLKYLPKGQLPKADRPWGTGVLGYKVLSEDPECHLMAMQELKFIDLVRNEQKIRAEKEMNKLLQ